MANYNGGSPQSEPNNPLANGISGSNDLQGQWGRSSNGQDEVSSNAPSAGLSGGGDNPWSQGAPRSDLYADSNVNYGLGANNPAQQWSGYNAMPGRYYTNPPAVPANPYANGAVDAADDLSAYASGGLQAKYADALDSSRGAGANPDTTQNNVDAGFKPSGS